MKFRLVSFALLIALLGAVVAAPLASAAPKASNGPFDVTGTLSDSGTFVGTVSDLVFQNHGNQLTVSGTLDGIATLADGTTQAIDEVFTTTVSPAVNTACTILTLDIGAIHLDLLGLVVDIAPISIDVTAVPGAGNLLGNLLCGIAGLLDGGPLGRLAVLLNNLFGLLG